MAMTIKELESQLSGLQTYTPETEDALRQRAENIYNPQYQQDLQSIRDSLQQGINQQNRNMISAGMQRSSYGQSAIAALRGQGLKAEAQLGAQRDANIATLLNQLIEGEKDRKLNADANRDNLLLQLYQLSNKGGSGKATVDPNKVQGPAAPTAADLLKDVIRDAYYAANPRPTYTPSTKPSKDSNWPLLESVTNAAQAGVNYGSALDTWLKGAGLK